MNTNNRVYIFDTTLRDGQQCPGAGMSFEENITYARLAARLGIDVLEAGFPSASALDFNIVQEIAATLSCEPHSPIIAALCQLRREQIERTLEALSPAIARKKGRLHIYLPVDPQLMRASLGERALKKDELIEEVYQAALYATSSGAEVEFSPEGYSRMRENFSFCTDLIRAAISGGATVINCPDTVGGASRYEGNAYFVEHMKQHATIIKKEFPERNIIWSTHCHNDLGLALENSLHAVFDGPARQIEGCINGVGERAGNVALEQIAITLSLLGEKVSSEAPFFTHIDTTQLSDISQFVATHMLPLQPHWPITGSNASRHSSGGHTNAILRNPLVYQAFDPALVGQEVTLLFGPLSGGNHAKDILLKFGIVLSDSDKAAFAQFVKDRYSHRRKGVTDEEVLSCYVEFGKSMSSIRQEESQFV